MSESPYSEVERLIDEIQELQPRYRLLVARTVIENLCDKPQNFTYAEFQAAQAVEKFTKQARSALRKLSLT